MSAWPSDFMSIGYAPLLHMYGHQGPWATSSTFVNEASATWPAANRAMYVPIRLGHLYFIKVMWLINGDAVSGNVDIGIFDRAGTKLVSSGSVAQSGTDTGQVVNVTDTVIGPGLFWLGIAMSSTSAQVWRTTRLGVEILRSFGVFEQDSAFPLPSVASFAAKSEAFLPVFGAANRTIV